MFDAPFRQPPKHAVLDGVHVVVLGRDQRVHRCCGYGRCFCFCFCFAIAVAMTAATATAAATAGDGIFGSGGGVGWQQDRLVREDDGVDGTRHFGGKLDQF